jgi:hypothetical protein
VGNIPWNALVFFTLYLQLLGMSDFDASLLMARVFPDRLTTALRWATSEHVQCHLYWAAANPLTPCKPSASPAQHMSCTQAYSRAQIRRDLEFSPASRRESRKCPPQAMFLGATAIGGLIGGWVGDRAAKSYANHGRIFVVQFSVSMGPIFSVLLLKVRKG